MAACYSTPVHLYTCMLIHHSELRATPLFLSDIIRRERKNNSMAICAFSSW